MNRKQWIILGAIGVLGAFIAWLAWSSRQAPMLPRGEPHAVFEDAGTCLSCHGPEGAVPQAARHPLGEDCLRCHGRR